jgi:hypothetical protein
MLSKQKPEKPGGNEDRKIQAYLSFFILVIIAILAANLFWYAPISRVDFYDELWAPSHLLLQGKSPYNTSSLGPMEHAAWFPMAIGFYFPLGWLKPDIANQVWFLISVVWIGLIVYVGQSKIQILNTAIAAFLCFFFPPTLHHFALGQISVTVVLCLVLAVQFLEQEQEWLSAFMIALSFSKPHLAILPVAGICYGYFLHKPKAIVPFIGKIIFMMALLCVPLFIAFPGWIPDAVASMSAIPSWPYPSLFTFLPKYLGSWGYIVWGFITIAALVLSYFQWKNHPSRIAMYWSLALTSLISAYIGSWDFVALFPLLIFTFSEVDWKRKVFIIVSYGIAWRVMALVQAQHNGLNYYFWWVPLWFICTLAFVTNWRLRETI